MTEKQFDVIGKSVPRKDAIEKINGQAKFVCDLSIPRMLHSAFLRSPYAHARIKNIDTSRAEALPGVKVVLTHKNTPKVHAAKRKFEWLLDEVVHYAGEEVAAVAADTEAIAKEAIKLIEVEYEPLTAVFDPEQAMEPGAPVIHPEYKTNIYHGTQTNPFPRMRPDGWLELGVGDVEKGFAEADVVLENVYESGMQYPCSPIPRSVICEWTGEKLTCWADSQTPMMAAKDMARNLRIPIASVRLIATYPVGGYGSKSPDKTAILAALMAKAAGRPVKAVFSRAEDFVSTHRRDSYKAYEKIGVKKDGTITAFHHRMIGNCGRDHGACLEVLSHSACASGNTLYPAPNVKFEGCMVMTNLPDISPMIGMGDPEAVFNIERIVDEAAEAINMDPADFRAKNCAHYGTRSIVRREAAGVSHDDMELRPGPVNWGIVGKDFDSLRECIAKATEAAGWRSKWKGWKTPVEIRGSKRRGIGIGIGMHISDFREYSATVKMNQDGTANVHSSAAEIGQGISTIMAQVVAEAIGIEYKDVEILLGDTVATPEGWGVVASGGTSSAVTAVKLAADNARGKIFEVAAKHLGVKPEELDSRNRRIFVKSNPGKSMAVAEACLRGYQIVGTANNPSPDSIIDPETGKVIKSYACGCSVAEVEVDMDTGFLDMLKLTVAQDCGRAINPVIVVNQIDMGVIIGNGYVRTEDYVYDRRSGVILNPNLLDYKIITILDMPRSQDFTEMYVERQCAWGPFGAKGHSETACVTPAQAIANAVYNAAGVRIRGPLFTPDRILMAIKSKKQ